MNKEDKIKEIKNMWFDNHVASITEAGPATILEWRMPGTNMYSVRYVMLGNNLFISGDLGEAVFNLTWNATIDSFQDIHLNYLMEKLACSSRQRWNFNGNYAKEELANWLEENLALYDEEDSDEISETKRLYEELLECVDESLRVSDFEYQVWDRYESYSGDLYDAEEFEMISQFGQEMPMSFMSYLVGLQMAYKQIIENQEITA